MYLAADLFQSGGPPTPADPIEHELREIEELRRRAMSSRDILYCSPAVRHIVEVEVPRLIDIVRRLRRLGGTEGPAAADAAVPALLRELRLEVGMIRDLVERR